MPELPEVETIRMGLQKYLVGHTIESVDVRLKKMVSGETKDIVGVKVIDVRRFGKGLVIDFNNKNSIAIHVKMTGQLIYQGKKETKVSDKVGGALPNKSTHVIFHLNKGATLYYNDIRQFGWIKIIKTDDLNKLPFFKELGPEFFKDLDLPKFEKIISSAKKPIKPLLMEQKIMSGVGNIYANDALFDAGIDPRRPASSLSEEEIKKLFASIEKVLKKGLEVGGSSEWQYVNALGQEGGYQKIFMVYNKKKCQRCGGEITKIKLGGRGTYFCPKCQE